MNSELTIPPAFNSHLTFLAPITWEDIKSNWEQAEQSREDFIEMKVDTSWGEWRSGIVTSLNLENLSWELFDIDDIADVVPRFRGGPFKPWAERYYGGIYLPTFEQILNVPDTDVWTRDIFSSVKDEGPLEIVGLANNNDIFIIEGMHRCVALSVAAQRQNLGNVQVRIAIANTDSETFELVD